MAKAAADPNAVKKTRAAAKPRVMYLVTDTKLEGVVNVVKNGDELVQLMDKAIESGGQVFHRKLTIPAGR